VLTLLNSADNSSLPFKIQDAIEKLLIWNSTECNFGVMGLLDHWWFAIWRLWLMKLCPVAMNK
jgi:hypothetical protein